jgi:hypothetical protein
MKAFSSSMAGTGTVTVASKLNGLYGTMSCAEWVQKIARDEIQRVVFSPSREICLNYRFIWYDVLCRADAENHER